jgi:hypothetical protein
MQEFRMQNAECGNELRIEDGGWGMEDRGWRIEDGK